jgi:hypothetical protein
MVLAAHLPQLDHEDAADVEAQLKVVQQPHRQPAGLKGFKKTTAMQVKTHCMTAGISC